MNLVSTVKKIRACENESTAQLLLEQIINEETAKLNNRLLNAFQLVKNGKKIGYLKFDAFSERMDLKHDHNGNEI